MLGREIMKYFAGDQPADETADWLRRTYFVEVVRAFNSTDSRKCLGLYGGEKIPENERNLTDVRNRVSLIIEYEIARLSNDLIQRLGVTDYFWSYVVANRFPDLEVRGVEGNRTLRVEIKCLQSIAEEKAANFDTLIKDLNPHTDFIVVLLWEWDYSSNGSIPWDRAPKILNSYVFNAFALASLRDSYWLNRPHGNLGSGYQGFDLRYAVNCNAGIYSEEEGNYGKLTRIWQSGFQFRPTSTPALLDAEVEYLKFKKEVAQSGFRSLYERLLPKLSGVAQVVEIIDNGIQVGARSGEFAFFFKSLVREGAANSLCLANGCNYMVFMTDRYKSTGYEVRIGGALKIFNELKPKAIERDLFSPA